MGVTRRYWGEAGLVVVLAGLTVLFDRPLLLLGAAGVGGWLLAQQYAFVRTVNSVAADISVAQSTENDVVAEDGDTQVNLMVELPRPAPVSLVVETSPPPGVKVVEDEAGGGKTKDTPSVVVPPGEKAATTTFTVRCPLAGTFEFDPATVTATDETGHFRTAFAAGAGPTLTVEARGPQNLHVGAGGEALDSTYGQHKSNERGPGIDLAEIRAYVPGDAVRQIDWNATARLGEPHVREFETDTERRTVILLDRRASMGTGPDGETQFDYVRQVALGIVSHARERGEPVAIYEVGEEGLLAHQRPTAIEDGYVRLERRLRAVEPHGGGATGRAGAIGDGFERRGGREPRGGRERRERDVHSPAVARQRAYRLQGDDSAFADRLGPFFAAADPYAQRITDDPLYGVARTHLKRLRGAVTTVVLTNDIHRTETQEVVKVAGRHDNHVLAFLTPTVLFERDESANPEATYERYADFERFRRNLASIDGVSAFEVGPGDRLDALLAANRNPATVRAGN